MVGTLCQWAALNCFPVQRVLYDIIDQSFPIHVYDVIYNVHEILHKFQYFVYPFVEEAYQNEGFRYAKILLIEATELELTLQMPWHAKG